MTDADKQNDIPLTRQTLERLATKFNIYFLLIMAVTGVFLFVTGLFTTDPNFLKGLPDSVVQFVLGFLTFALFFPWFTSLYFARHFLITQKRVEFQAEGIRRQISDLEVMREEIHRLSQQIERLESG